MNDPVLLGLDGGATKVLAQACTIDHKSSLITPKGDFDFNVVIRSILYNAKNKYASFMVGGAITAKAIPAQEYEECLVKAKAMFEVLGNA